MKKKILILLFIFTYMNIYASELNFTFSQNRQTRSLTLDVVSKTIGYKAKISQEESGRFLFAGAPFPLIKSGKIDIGEIKYNSGGLIKIYNMSLYPKQGGLSYRSKNIDFAIFSPLFAPSGPIGSALFVRHKGLSAKIVYKENTEKNINKTPNEWQVSWDKKRTLGRQLETSFVIQNRFSKVLVENTMSSNNSPQYLADLTFSAKGFYYHMKINGNLEREVSFSKNFSRFDFNVKYKSKTGSKPVYGGTSQSASFNLLCSLSYKRHSIICENITQYPETGGKQALTKYSVRYSGSNLRTEISTTYIRTIGAENGFTFPSFSIQAKNVQMRSANEKTRFELKYNFNIGLCKLEFTLAENRTFSLNGKITI